MQWVPWNQAIIASVISMIIAVTVARQPSTPGRVLIISLCREFSLIAFLYTLWRLAVSATGNHWWLDGIAAIALVGIALRIDNSVRRQLGSVSPWLLQ